MGQPKNSKQDRSFSSCHLVPKTGSFWATRSFHRPAAYSNRRYVSPRRGKTFTKTAGVCQESSRILRDFQEAMKAASRRLQIRTQKDWEVIRKRSYLSFLNIFLYVLVKVFLLTIILVVLYFLFFSCFQVQINRWFKKDPFLCTSWHIFGPFLITLRTNFPPTKILDEQPVFG